jgi:hypothetical protein
MDASSYDGNQDRETRTPPNSGHHRYPTSLDMKEIDDTPKTQTFYDSGIKDGDTIMIKRKPITVIIKIPEGDDGDSVPDLVIKVDPDEDDLDTIG